jgi:hypothetical protein
VRQAGRSITVLPYEPRADMDAWLLKMHGSVTQPEDIVLTRQDYLRYAERRAALAGIVQALLITRRMLFVGFSLRDDNFHRIADDVRRALGDRRSGTFGTTLLLHPEALLQDLWRDDMSFVTMGDDEAAGPAGLEIFLDRLLALAPPNTAHLLDPSFSGVLTESERELRDHLDRLAREAPAGAREAPAWADVERLLDALGRRPTER